MPWKWSTFCLLVVTSCAGAPPAVPVVPPHADPAVLAQEDAAWQARFERLQQEGRSLRDIVDEAPHVPYLGAEVVRVQNREVVLRITANPERCALRRYVSFMLYRDKTYLGEAVVQEVLPDFTVRCRHDLVKGQVVPGDLASTGLPE